MLTPKCAQNGDLTPEMRKKIDQYVETTFGSRVPAENVSYIKFFLFFFHNYEGRIY